MTNQGLNEQLRQYNALQNTIDNDLISLTENNPIVKMLQNQKKKLKQDIANSLAASKDEIQLKDEQIRKQLGKIGGDIRKVPTVERVYLDFARLQSIKQEMYVFLLKKKRKLLYRKHQPCRMPILLTLL